MPSHASTMPGAWRRFVALGDSFTEGLSDITLAHGRHRGWADLVALELAARAAARGEDGIEYANLAVRGRLIRDVVRDQVPCAVDLEPDLASLAVGVNDSLRRHFDLNAAATGLESGVRQLREGGADVLLFAFGDPSRRSVAMAGVRTRILRYNSAVEAIAERYGCRLVSFWQVAAFDDDRFWDADRLHLSPDGHELAARAALEALGLVGGDWRTPVVPGASVPPHRRLAGHARWTSDHLLPWLVRRARGQSSGDGIDPKHPDWVRVRSPDEVADGEPAK